MLWSCLNIKEISHICEEGGSHLRISLWHLMMTLKNNYLLKKLLKWANKQCKNFNIYNVVFFYKKNERKIPGDIIILHMCTKNLDGMIYNSWDIWRARLQLVILGYFLTSPSPSVPLKLEKSEFKKKWKKLLEISFYTCVPKTTIIWFMVPVIRSEKERTSIILGYTCKYLKLHDWAISTVTWRRDNS